MSEICIRRLLSVYLSVRACIGKWLHPVLLSPPTPLSSLRALTPVRFGEIKLPGPECHTWAHLKAESPLPSDFGVTVAGTCIAVNQRPWYAIPLRLALHPVNQAETKKKLLLVSARSRHGLNVNPDRRMVWMVGYNNTNSRRTVRVKKNIVCLLSL